MKVWIFKGEIMEHDPMAQDKRLDEAAEAPSRGAAGAQARRERTGIGKAMLQPARTKFRKQHKGRIHGAAKGGYHAGLRRIGLKATEPERVTARQIEAARRALTRHMKRAGRVWIRVFPDVPVSKKPAEVRMGSGKGAPEFWVCKIKPGRILFEVDGVSRATGEGGDAAGGRQTVRSRPNSSRVWRREDGHDQSQRTSRDAAPDQLADQLAQAEEGAVQSALPARQRSVGKHQPRRAKCAATSRAS